MVMEAKATEADDPFGKSGQKHIDTIIQLAISARNLFFAHAFLAAFVVGIYGNNARIIRFDHTCAVVSKPFAYRERPEILQQFFWRFVNPCVGATVVGCDPAVEKLDLSDLNWVQQRLNNMQWGLTLTPKEFYKGRRLKVPENSDFQDGCTRTRTLILFDLLDLAIGLDESNPDPMTPESHLTAYRLVTLVWWPVQFVTDTCESDMVPMSKQPQRRLDLALS